MYQLNFSKQSIDFLNKLDRLEQMRLVESFSALTPEILAKGSENLGKFQRESRLLYRLRAGEYRIYFEVNEKEKSLMAHYILGQHSLSDFIVRFKLPIADSLLLEEHPSFWDYLESFKK